MRIKKIIVVGSVITAIIALTIKNIKIGPCSQELETTVNKQND